MSESAPPLQKWTMPLEAKLLGSLNGLQGALARGNEDTRVAGVLGPELEEPVVAEFCLGGADLDFEFRESADLNLRRGAVTCEAAVMGFELPANGRALRRPLFAHPMKWFAGAQTL